jgi:hypothetical protein
MGNLTNLAFYAYLVRLTANAAHALGNTADEQTYNDLFECVKGGFNAKYWRAGGYYAEANPGTASQAAAVMAESGDGGKTLRAENARCVSLVGVQGDAVVYRVGSGRYQFSIGSANLPAGTPKGCYA